MRRGVNQAIRADIGVLWAVLAPPAIAGTQYRGRLAIVIMDRDFGLPTLEIAPTLGYRARLSAGVPGQDTT